MYESGRIMTEDEIIGYLIDSLEDDRKDFSVFAIKQLKHYHSAKIIEKLLEIVESAEDIDKKVAALNSLKKRKPSLFTKSIVLKQLFSPQEEIRTEAANLLLEFDEELISDLEKLMSDKAPDYTVGKIVWLLGNVGNPDTLINLDKSKETIPTSIKPTFDDAIENIKRKYTKLMFKEIEKKEIK